MLRWSLILSFALLHTALAQEPPELRLPHTGRDPSPRVTNVTKDPISSYSNRHEAALAALQAGYRASTVERRRGRAIRFLLVSLRRDPYVAKTLYDMGVLCAQDDRWRDALSFYQAAQKANPDAALVPQLASEIERVQTIEQLESTPDGKKRRQFDTRLLEVIEKNKDREPFAALTDIRDLAALDATRWEPAALAGVMHAKAGAFLDSAKDLEDAANRAPVTRQEKLRSAAIVARREASFAEQVKSADELWEKQQYDSAAKLYEKAWEDSPGHLDVAMEAATGFLMADQVPLAVGVLFQLRDTRSDDLSAKAVAMLKELGAISEDAKREAAQQPAPSAAAQFEDAAKRIADLVPQLTTPQMELAAKPNPPLVPDNTSIIQVPDEELTAGHNDDALLSTDSVFALYQRDLPAVAAPPPVEAQPTPAPDATPAASPGAAALTDRPTLPRTLPPPGPLGAPSPAAPRAREAGASVAAGRLVSVESTPPGAALVFDEDASVNCTAPCQVPLAPGRHTLLATMAGYRNASKIFTVDKNSATVEVTLEAKVGFLTVVSQTPGAAVFLDGKKTDKQTPAQFTLAEGKYVVGIQVAGEMVEREVTITDGALMRVPF